MERCYWASQENPELMNFHDKEWGKPQHNEQKLFEILCLMVFQTGLRWQFILKRRSVLKNLFCDFRIEQIKDFNDYDISKMFKVKKMIANQRKTQAVIHNAKVLDKLHSKNITLEELVWGVTNGEIVDNHWIHPEQIPTKNLLSIELTKRLKKEGFIWVGEKNMYAYLQTVGVINDHLIGCDFR